MRRDEGGPVAPVKKAARKQLPLMVSLLLATSVALYSRPAGVSATTCVAIVALLTGLVFLGVSLQPNANGLWAGRLVGHAAVFGLVIYFTSLAILPESQAFGITIATVVAPLVAAILVGNALTSSQFAVVAERALLGVVLVSVVVALLDPGAGLTQVEENNGTLRGLYTQRNSMGYILILAVAFAVSRWVQSRSTGERYRVAWRACVYVPALLWCGSSAALGISFLLVVVGWRMRQREAGQSLRGKLVLLGMFAVALFPLLAVSVVNLLGVFNKTASFDGRLAIWSSSLDKLSERPLTGFGRGISLDQGNAAADFIAATVGYYVRSFHNSYLALAVESGLIAATVGILLWLRVVWGSFGPGFVRSTLAMAPWPALLSIAYATDSMVENRQFIGLGWFLLCCQAVYLDRFAREQKRISASLAEEEAQEPVPIGART